MFDKDGFLQYFKSSASANYVIGLKRTEDEYSVSIDEEYESDKCESLLLKLHKDKSNPSLDENKQHQKKNQYSHLKKYIEYKIHGTGNKPRIVDQFRECFKSYAIGTRLSRQEIIKVIHDRFGTNETSIIPSDYCYNMTNKGKHTEADFFLNIETGLYEYVGENYKGTAILDIIAAYKKDFARINEEERYKWEAIGWYKRHWDLSASNFSRMFTDAFSKAANLLAANMYYPYKMVIEFAESEPDTVRALFKMLYDESIPLAQRYLDFRAGFDKYVKPLGKNHYQDLHAVSVYLSFEHPETYYIYKYRVYKGFASLIGFSEEKAAGKSEVWKIENYNRMCDAVLESVRTDKELIEMSQDRFDESCYTDDALHLLTMDVVYFGSKLSSEEAPQSDADYWPSLEEYDPGISVEEWKSVLSDDTVTSSENRSMLKMILEQGGESTCANLALKYGNVHNYYNKLGSSYGEKVKKKLGCPDCYDGNTIRFYPIPFLGRNIVEGGKKHYSWKLRDELKEALLSMGLSEIEMAVEPVPTTDVGKNTILYGPPGTGKTYYTAIYAVAIIEGKQLSTVIAEDYDDVLERYNAYKADGLIEFTTFHQSYGYEEFIEGIKPVMEADSEEQTDIQYETAPGLFKDFCDRASRPVLVQNNDMGINGSPTVWKVSLEGTGDNPTRSECLKNGHIRIGWDSYGEVVSSDMEFSEGGKNVLNAFIYKMKLGDIVLSCYSATTIDAVGVVTGEYEWHDEYESYKRLRKVNWIVSGIRENITDMNNGSNMTLSSVYKLGVSLPDVMSIIEKSAPEANEVEANGNNYVFVIDEINRGNISKVFGELITLIEPSKRIGQPEGMTVKLPYSKKPFGVPDNVYIIGTMNTADRSIATIDTALRRRFQFKEMQPDADVLDGVSVEDLSIKDMLIRMNRRIAVLYDRDHTIGHAYFMPLKKSPTIETLADIFANNIIPLLQEYFYEDYEKIRLVLGDNQKENADEQFIIANANDYIELFGDTDFGFDDTVSYELNYKAFDNIEAYRAI
jgi:hypothetical protein